MGSVNTVRDAAEGGKSRTDRDGDPVAEKPSIDRCFDCRREENTARSCTTATITFPDGTVREAIRYEAASEETSPDRCPGCRVLPGGFHHPYCPVEACPRCGGRLVACSCLDSDKTR